MANEMTFSAGMLYHLREAVGDYIAKMGEEHPKMVVVVPDLMTSSRVKGFVEKYPDRFFNVGISEGSMIGWSAGMAKEGYIPYAFGFAPFVSMRAGEQVRDDICYPNLPVRIIASYAGYSSGLSGATHTGVEDCAIMTSFPNMTVIEPGDPSVIAKVLEATADLNGPVYIRLGIEATTTLYSEDTVFEIGKALIPHKGNDGAFVTSGIVSHYAVEAAKKIKEETGANIRVVDMLTIKPLDKEAVLSAAKTGRIVCAQDHNIIGGLGYAVGTVLAEAGANCKFKILGCPDKFVPLATPEFLYKKNEYDVEGLIKNMKAFL